MIRAEHALRGGWGSGKMGGLGGVGWGVSLPCPPPSLSALMLQITKGFSSKPGVGVGGWEGIF